MLLASRHFFASLRACPTVRLNAHSPRRRHPSRAWPTARRPYTASLVSLSLASLGHSLDARLSQLRCSVASRRFVSAGSFAQLDRERLSLAQFDWERLSLAPPSAATLAKPRQPSTTSLYFPPPSNTSHCPRIRSSLLQYTITSLPTLFRPGWVGKVATNRLFALSTPRAIVMAGLTRARRGARGSSHHARPPPTAASRPCVL